jgi:hypothetical protein
MRAIFNRLHRLENASAAERKQAAAEAIMEARRQRLGAAYERMVFPEDWFADCRGTADHIFTRSPVLAGTQGSRTGGRQIGADNVNYRASLTAPANQYCSRRRSRPARFGVRQSLRWRWRRWSGMMRLRDARFPFVSE